MSGGELVPFGKHKGKPVEVMLADPGYRDWLLAQPWVRDRSPSFHQTIINYGGEPVETPEHNELQASFLDDRRCLALGRLLLPAGVFDGTDACHLLQRTRAHYGESAHGVRYKRFEQHLEPQFDEPRVYGRRFEVGGWDVVFRLQPTALFPALTSLPACLCSCDHERDCPGGATCRGGEDAWRCRHRYHHERFVPMIDRTYGHLARDSEEAIRARLDARRGRSDVLRTPSAEGDS
jgi:hypothetical protein